MLISEETAGLIAQLVVLLWIPTIIQLLKFRIPKLQYEFVVAAVILAAGTVLWGMGTVANLVEIVALGGKKVEYPGTLTAWIWMQFASPLVLLGLTQVMSRTFRDLAHTRENRTSNWASVELWRGLRDP
ncbi:hypothetical protein [Homoserinimonas sp. A520]